MGHPVPPDWPELEDGKWYCCFSDTYKAVHPGPVCTDEHEICLCCVRQKDAIDYYWDNGGAGQPGNPLCGVVGLFCERVSSIYGPFDTEALADTWCMANCICP